MNNQHLISKQQLLSITVSMLSIILLDCIWTERQGLIATLSLAGALPLTFYLAIYPIKINLNKISNVLDPKLWLPLSYVIYFVALPCLSIVFDSKYSMYNDEIPQMMLSTILGIVSLQIGLYIIKPEFESIQKETRLGRNSAMFLLLFAIILHIYYWYWRIENGFFFTHGRGYSPIPNILTGIRDLLGGSVTCIPLYILAVAFRNRLWKKGITLWFFIIYACGTLALFFLAGQIRSMFFFLLMILAASIYMTQIKKIRWGRISTGVLIVFISCFFVIYSARFSQSQIHQEENQIEYILLNLPSIIKKGHDIAATSGGMAYHQLYRIFMPQEFFLQTIRALNENSSYGYGIYTTKNLPLIVPRLLWPEKGAVEDTEVLIQQNVLSTKPYDFSLTPLTQFYVEGNIAGILIGFFLFGFISSYAHRACFSINNRIGGLTCWVLILCSIIELENNIPICLLLGIRNGFIFVVLAFAISAFRLILSKAVWLVPKQSHIPNQLF